MITTAEKEGMYIQPGELNVRLDSRMFRFFKYAGMLVSALLIIAVAITILDDGFGLSILLDALPAGILAVGYAIFFIELCRHQNMPIGRLIKLTAFAMTMFPVAVFLMTVLEYKDDSGDIVNGFIGGCLMISVAVGYLYRKKLSVYLMFFALIFLLLPAMLLIPAFLFVGAATPDRFDWNMIGMLSVLGVISFGYFSAPYAFALHLGYKYPEAFD